MSCSPMLWFNNKKALNQALFNMHIKSLSKPHNTHFSPQKVQSFDLTSLLSDEILLQIFSKLPKSQQDSIFLVSKRWLYLQGRLIRSIKLQNWNFLISNRLFIRFPNLTHVDLIHACVISPQNSGISITHKFVSFQIDPKDSVFENYVLPSYEIDVGLRVLASGCPNLRKLGVINMSEVGLLSVVEECPTLQELELHWCNDQVLVGIGGFENLQLVKLVGNVDGFYGSLVSDIGLTILAQGCRRLVRLELSGCEGSYDGVKAIGQCCQMLEELSFCDHRMGDGWLSALSYCENLKSLRFFSCKRIDCDPGPVEHLGFCRTLERLHLEKCQLRDKGNVRALFLVSQGVKEIVFRNCWGLDDENFCLASVCRSVKSLSLESCSMLTIQGLESVILHWKELESLSVISCNNIKDVEVTPELSALFSVLKYLKWKPDTKSLLSGSLEGTGMGKRGGKFFKKM